MELLLQLSRKRLHLLSLQGSRIHSYYDLMRVTLSPGFLPGIWLVSGAPLAGRGLDVLASAVSRVCQRDHSLCKRRDLSRACLFQNPGTWLCRWIPWIPAASLGLACLCARRLLDFLARARACRRPFQGGRGGGRLWCGADGPLRADCGAAGDSMGCVAVYLTRRGLRLLPGSTRGKGRLTQGDVGRRGSPSPGVRMSGRLAGLLHSTISPLEHQHVVMLPTSSWQDLQGVMDPDLRAEILLEDALGTPSLRERVRPGLSYERVWNI